MKKWIIFFSITCIICAILFGFETTQLNDLIDGYKFRNQNNGYYGLAKEYIPYIVRVAISMFLLLILFIFTVFMFVNIILGKLPSIDIKDNIEKFKLYHAERKALRKQRKLEKAQAKVEQLQNDIQKDDQ